MRGRGGGCLRVTASRRHGRGLGWLPCAGPRLGSLGLAGLAVSARCAALRFDAARPGRTRSARLESARLGSSRQHPAGLGWTRPQLDSARHPPRLGSNRSGRLQRKGSEGMEGMEGPAPYRRIGAQTLAEAADLLKTWILINTQIRRRV